MGIIDANTEKIILTNLIYNSEYVRKVFPYLKLEYFQDVVDRIIFSHIQQFISKYNLPPTREALIISMDNDSSIDEEIFNSAKNSISGLVQTTQQDLIWLIDLTEKFCQQKSIYNAVTKTIKIFQGEDKKNDLGSIPKLLGDAIAVCFDPKIGHSYIEDSSKRFDFYHTIEEKIAFDLTYFNRITSGGLSKKSLNIILAGTGVGKSLAMCHLASANLLNGKNVLYITLEMSEEKIAERIDANLLDINIEDMKTVDEITFKKKVDELRKKTVGRLIIKEYPTSVANTNHFRHLLNELQLRQNFKPDIVYVDYINLCCSSRVKMGASINSYSLIKSIAEELRGLAVEYNVPIVSATQTNRAAYNSTDFGLENTSESFGLPATADLMIALISTEELEKLNQILVKQLKNRYNDVSKNRKFVVGIDRSKMRLYDLEESAQQNIVSSDDKVSKKAVSPIRKRDKVIDKSKLNEIDFDDDMF